VCSGTTYSPTGARGMSHSGYFADPDGHAWEVAWNPDWTIADDGSVSLHKQG